MSKVIEITSANFKEEIEDFTGKVLIDFWAEWCGPCQQMLPILDQFNEEYGDQVKVCKVNVDKAPEIAGKFRVMSIPTLIGFDKGEPISPLVGVTEIDNRNNHMKDMDLVTYMGLEYKD